MVLGGMKLEEAGTRCVRVCKPRVQISAAYPCQASAGLTRRAKKSKNIKIEIISDDEGQCAAPQKVRGVKRRGKLLLGETKRRKEREARAEAQRNAALDKIWSAASKKPDDLPPVVTTSNPEDAFHADFGGESDAEVEKTPRLAPLSEESVLSGLVALNSIVADLAAKVEQPLMNPEDVFCGKSDAEAEKTQPLAPLSEESDQNGLADLAAEAELIAMNPEDPITTEFCGEVEEALPLAPSGLAASNSIVADWAAEEKQPLSEIEQVEQMKARIMARLNEQPAVQQPLEQPTQEPAGWPDATFVYPHSPYEVQKAVVDSFICLAGLLPQDRLLARRLADRIGANVQSSYNDLVIEVATCMGGVHPSFVFCQFSVPTNPPPGCLHRTFVSKYGEEADALLQTQFPTEVEMVAVGSNSCRYLRSAILSFSEVQQFVKSLPPRWLAMACCSGSADLVRLGLGDLREILCHNSYSFLSEAQLPECRLTCHLHAMEMLMAAPGWKQPPDDEIDGILESMYPNEFATISLDYYEAWTRRLGPDRADAAQGRLQVLAECMKKSAASR